MQAKNYPDELFLSSGAGATYGADWALQEYEVSPHRSILERLTGYFTQEQRKRFDRLGALPHLLSYRMRIFTALWECDDHEVHQELTRFAGLNWVEELPDGTGWAISKSVLKYAAELLLAADDGEKKKAQQWLKRMDVKAVSIQFGKDHPVRTRRFFELKRQGPRLRPNVLVRVIKQFVNPSRYSPYWNLFMGSEPWMRSEEWLAARYLYQKDVKTFRWARGISVFFIFISLLGDDTLPVKDVVVAILISPILLLLLVSIIFLTPWLRNSEAISLQIWHAVQERRGEGE